MLQNTSTFFEEEEKAETEFNSQKQNGASTRENDRAVSKLPKEEHCTLYIWDNYLVQSFHYELEVYSQLQGTRIVLNKGSRSSRYSELENPKAPNNQKHSLTCQLYKELGQKAFCEICSRPRVFCTSVKLHSPVRTLEHSIDIQEKTCYICEQILKECECEDLFQFSRSIMENENSAVVYLLQNEQETQVTRQISGKIMKETGVSACRIPIRYNNILPERGVRYCKIQKPPVPRSGDLELTCFGRGNKKIDTSKCRHCAYCARPLARCVCENLRSVRQKKERPLYPGRLSLQSQCGKFNYFPQRYNSNLSKDTRNKTTQEGNQLTQCIDKMDRSRGVMQMNRFNYGVARGSPECRKMTEAMVTNKDSERYRYNKYESKILDTDSNSSSEEKGTYMENDFPQGKTLNSFEKRQNLTVINKDMGQQMDKFEVAVQNSLCKPNSIRSEVQNKVVNAAEQLMNEEFTIKKALDDLNITVTISKQTEDTPLSNFSDEKSAIRYGNLRTSPNIENFERYRMIENVHQDMQSYLKDHNSKLSPHFTITEQKSVLTNSVAEINDEYSCKRIESKKYVMGKLFIKSLEGKKHSIEASGTMKKTNKTNFTLNSNDGSETENPSETERERQYFLSKQIMHQLPRMENEDQCGFDCLILRKLAESKGELRFSSNNQPRKILAEKFEATAVECMKPETDEEPSLKSSNENEGTGENEILKSDRYTSDTIISPEIATKETQYEEETSLYKKSRFSSINGRIVEMNDVSTELEFLVSQEVIARHLRLPCCLGENSIKLPSSKVTTQNFSNKQFTDNTCIDRENIEAISVKRMNNTSIDRENIEAISVKRMDSTRILSTKSETYLEINKSTKSRITISKHGREKEAFSHLNETYLKQFEDNHRQNLEKNPQMKTETEESQTGGIFEQDFIASIVANFNSNSKSTSQSCLFNNLSYQIAADDSEESNSRQFGLKLPKESKNSIVALCLNTFKQVRSIPIQMGPSFRSKCGETQTVPHSAQSESKKVCEAPSPRLFRKKFNYVCGPDGPGFKTKISMNLNQLLQVDDNSYDPLESSSVDGEAEDMENRPKPEDFDDAHAVYGSTKIAKLKESTNASRKPCYRNDDTRDEQRIMKKCAFSLEPKLRNEKRLNELEYSVPMRKQTYKNQNVNFAAYYSTNDTFVPTQLGETSEKKVISKDSIPGERQQNTDESKNNTKHSCCVRRIQVNEKLDTSGIFPINSGKATFGNVVRPMENEETELDQTDNIALESAVNNFIKMKNECIEDTK